MNTNNKTNILIIDDNTKNIQLAANVLKSTNLYNIFFATSGKAGINQLALRDYSLILLDINMPELDGYETAKIIKRDSNYKKIPIIFLSANSNRQSIRKGFEVGGEDYVSKPFDDIELIHRVKTHVELFLARERLKDEVKDTKILLKQYQMAVDESTLVSKTNINGIITYVNDRFCKVSKYSRAELMGKNHNIVRSPNMDSESFKDLWHTIENKDVWRGVIENRAKDGSSYFVESIVMPILNSSGSIVEYISLRTNITKEIELRQDIVATQKEIIYKLGNLAEMRSKETSDHVNRVALISELLAKENGCSKEDIELLKMASPMHDIGKVVIPDSILLKSDKLTKEESKEMKKHTTYGWEVFSNSKYKLLRVAASIACEHHERWDGRGYPNALKGEDIDIFSRITSVADVFDALTHARVYKKAWSIEETIAYMKKESGKSFEPKLVELLLKNIDKVIKINEQYNK